MDKYINLSTSNINKEHICCAISDKKHQEGVVAKKQFIKGKLKDGYVFRKLDDRGKVFIEYENVENAFVPIIGENYYFIYCLWVSGKFKGKGHAENLINYAINDAKEKGKNGLCVIVGKKKKHFLSEKKVFEKFGFKLIDNINNYELLALSFNDNRIPRFSENAREQNVKEDGIVIYYTNQCPYTKYCLIEIEQVCKEENLKLTLYKIDSVEKAKSLPFVINNFCVFKDGEYITHEVVNASRFRKYIGI